MPLQLVNLIIYCAAFMQLISRGSSSEIALGMDFQQNYSFTSETSPGNQISMQTTSLISTTITTHEHATSDRTLEEIFHTIVRDFQFKRRAWSYMAIKYQGFLKYFGKWRLVTRLGGTYTNEGSIYFNKWNWDDALDTLTTFLAEMERYHHIYRIFISKHKADQEIQRKWDQRYPYYKQKKMDFMTTMSRYPVAAWTDGTTISGFLVPSDVKRIKEIERMLSCFKDTQPLLAKSLRKLFDFSHLVIRQSKLMQSQIKDPQETIILANLKRIIRNYVNLSELAWDDIPKLVSQASSSYTRRHCRQERLNFTDGTLEYNEISDLARSLSRQVLGYLLLLLKEVDRFKRAEISFQQQTNSSIQNDEDNHYMYTFLCRILREDIDKTLEQHLEDREMAELRNMLSNCNSTPLEQGKQFASILYAWKSIRNQISQEYSAFRQYSNRIPEILLTKSIIKVMLPMIVLVGVALNTVIIIYYTRHTPIKKVGRHLLFVLLAICDILILLIALLVLYTDNYMEHDQNLRPNVVMDAWCKFHTYLLNLTIETAAFLMVILSLERCMAVLSFFRHWETKTVTYKNLTILSLSALCFTCIFNCMIIIGDELAAPARSTVGHQCVHYVRLTNFENNLIFVTKVKPILNTLIRSLIPYNLVFIFNLVTCWYVVKKGNYFNLYRQDEERTEMELQSTNENQINASVGQLCLALVYLVLTAPAPVVYTMFMTAHGDRLKIKLTNGLYDEIDPAFRTHWQRIGHLTTAQYITEYMLIPISASINFLVFYGVDKRFKSFVKNVFRQKPLQNTSPSDETTEEMNLETSQSTAVYQLSETIS